MQDAAITALGLPSEQIAQLTEYWHQRRVQVLAKLAALRWPVRTAQGTFFLWLAAPPHMTGRQFAALLLEQAHLLVAPSERFGPAGQRYIRISLTAETDLIMRALDRVAALKLFG